MKRLTDETVAQIYGGVKTAVGGEKPYKVGKTWYIQCAKIKTVNNRSFACGKMYTGVSSSSVIESLNTHYNYNPEHKPSDDANTFK